MAKDEDVDAFLSEMAEYVKGKFAADPPEGAPAPPPKTDPPKTDPPADPPKTDPPKNEHGASKRWFG